MTSAQKLGREQDISKIFVQTKYRLYKQREDGGGGEGSQNREILRTSSIKAPLERGRPTRRGAAVSIDPISTVSEVLGVISPNFECSFRPKWSARRPNLRWSVSQ